MNHDQMVQGKSKYQLEKYLLINVKPKTSRTFDCQIKKFDITGLQPGVTFDHQSAIVKVDKDVVTSRLQFDMTVWVGSQKFDLPYVTVMPRKDPFTITLFMIISAALVLLVLLLLCIICCMCCRIKNLKSANAEVELSGRNSMYTGTNR